MTDPADRIRAVREALSDEMAKMPLADENGYAKPYNRQPYAVQSAMFANAVTEHVHRLAPDRAAHLLDLDSEEGSAFLGSLDGVVHLDPSDRRFADGIAAALDDFTNYNDAA